MGNSDPRCMRAAKRIAEWLQRDHHLPLDDFDVQRLASAIEADTGIRTLEVALMNARRDLGRVLDELPKD